MVKKARNEQVLTPYMKKIDDNLLKIHYKLAEITARLNKLERQQNELDNQLRRIMEWIHLVYVELLSREKEPFWRKVRRRIRELCKLRKIHT